MFQSRYRVCELFGIPIYIDISLVFLLLFFATGAGSLFIGIACALMLGLSITLHELGHSLTARAFGYETNDITLSLLGGCASIIALPRKWKDTYAYGSDGTLKSVTRTQPGAEPRVFTADAFRKLQYLPRKSTDKEKYPELTYVEN